MLFLLWCLFVLILILLALSHLVLSCLIFSYLIFSCLIFSCLVLSCLVSSCVVLLRPQGSPADIVPTSPWDGKDAVVEMEDEFSLDDLMKEEL